MKKNPSALENWENTQECRVSRTHRTTTGRGEKLVPAGVRGVGWSWRAFQATRCHWNLIPSPHNGLSRRVGRSDVAFKRLLGCSCSQTGFCPRLIFSTWFPVIRFRKRGCVEILPLDNWGRLWWRAAVGANLTAPFPIPPQHLGPGAHSSNDSGKTSTRKKGPWLLPYTLVNSLKVSSPSDGPDFLINWPCPSINWFLLTD